MRRIWQTPPKTDCSPNLIDDRCRIVLLVLCRKAFAFIEDEVVGLDLRPAALLGLRDGGDEIGTTSFLDDRLRGLPVRIEFPVPSRRLVRRVQYRVIEEWIGFWHE